MNRTRQGLLWLLFAIWCAWSGAALGWMAWNSDSGAICRSAGKTS